MKSARTRTVTLGLVAFMCCLAPFPIAANAATEDEAPTFTFDRVLEAISQEPAQRSAPGDEHMNPQAIGIHAVNLDEEWAVVDDSLVRSSQFGAISASTSEYVDVSWEPIDGAGSYLVVVDGHALASTTDTAYRYTFPGDPVRSHIQVIPKSKNGGTDDLPVIGLVATPPSGAQSLGDETAVDTTVERLAAAANSYQNASVIWRTFIPQARLDAPPAGCDYGNGYEFAGDNRGYSTSDTVSSRTVITRDVSWDSPIIGDPYFSVGWTHVYDKSTGAHVATELADDATFEAYKLGGDATVSNPGTYVDLRFGVHAGNPFCFGNSIEGAFTLTLTRNGSYVIPSGQHRQMPNHEIFIRAYTWVPGTPAVEYVTPIYQRDFLDPVCLVYLTCSPATMSGLAGSY